MAKTKATTLHTGPLIYKLPGNKWSCYAGKTRTVKQFTSTLRTFINGSECLGYWEKRKYLSSQQLKEVDWKSLGTAMRNVPLARRRWASKHMSGHFAHGKNMKHWKLRSSAQCPRCGAESEDKEHILRCPQEAATHKWHEAIQDLADWMKQQQTDPRLIHSLTMGLLAWWEGRTTKEDTPAFNQQSRLGWDAALDGWIGTEW